MVKQCVTINMLAPANIISTDISLNQTSCIEPCTVDVIITWQNTGDITGSFTPGIIVDDGAPITLPSVELGKDQTVPRTFTISGLMGGPHTVQASPNTGTVPQTINVIARGSASLSSIPSGAKIFIDNIDTGLVTPNTVANLIPGHHTYKLTLTGYYDATGEFDVVSGQTITVSPITMELIVGTLNISTTPPGASIYIDNSPTSSGITPAILTLTEGTHTYKLTLTGYYDSIGSFNIVRNQTTVLSIGLIQVTGDVFITSTPSGAEIFIDDIDQDVTTPHTITRLTVGTHRYKLTLTGYFDSIGTFDITPEQSTRLQATMIILPGNLSVESTPSGAEIFINGVDQGIATPNTIPNLAPGSYDIRLTLANYYDYTTTATIITQQMTTLNVTLNPLPGNLVINSTPSGAEIFINGEDQEVTTSATIPNLIPGTYIVKLTLADYYDLETDVVIGPNQTVTITKILNPLPGSLVVNSTPSGAEIFINGEDQGVTTPATIPNLIPGTYTIVLSYADYNDLTTTVIIGPNQTVTITKTLNPLPGTLIITSAPLRANIFIALTGQTPEDTEIVTPDPVTGLIPGTYDVKLKLDNYFDLVITGIIIGPNQTVTLTEETATLIPMPGTLTITSAPPGAKIFIAPTGQTPEDTGIVTPDPVIDLTPGTYDVKLTLANYHDYATNVTIGPNQGITLTVDMIPLPGFLDITSTPSGANIFIAPTGQTLVDQEVTTHSTISNLVPGTYDIKLTLTNYYDYTEIVTIGPNQGIYKDITLVPMPGSLTITSTPSGASIYIDGQLQVGTTPRTIMDLDPGAYTIKLTRSEYRDHTTDVTIGPNQAATLDIMMTLLPGGLVVNSTPPGASIYIDDIIQTGITTPATFVLDEGTHKLKLSLISYYDIEKIFNIIHMQTTTISEILVEATGDVLIYSIPSGAKIFIDGVEKIGVVTPITLTRLPAGTHSYRLTLPGYIDAEETFNIIVGQMIILSVTFTPQVVQKGPSAVGMILLAGLATGMVVFRKKDRDSQLPRPEGSRR